MTIKEVLERIAKLRWAQFDRCVKLQQLSPDAISAQAIDEAEIAYLQAQLNVLREQS